MYLGLHCCAGVPRICAHVVANPVEKRIYLCSPFYVFMKTIESHSFYNTHIVKAVLNTDYEACVCVFLITLQDQTAHVC